MKQVKVIFKESKHNYYTIVNGNKTNEEIQNYFIGKSFNTGDSYEMCIKVEIKNSNKRCKE